MKSYSFFEVDYEISMSSQQKLQYISESILYQRWSISLYLKVRDIEGTMKHQIHCYFQMTIFYWYHSIVSIWGTILMIAAVKIISITFCCPPISPRIVDGVWSWWCMPMFIMISPTWSWCCFPGWGWRSSIRIPYTWRDFRSCWRRRGWTVRSCEREISYRAVTKYLYT